MEVFPTNSSMKILLCIHFIFRAVFSHPIKHLHAGAHMSALRLSAREELEMFSAGTESAAVASIVDFRL
jgi:hypothetical protein